MVDTNKKTYGSLEEGNNNNNEFDEKKNNYPMMFIHLP